MTAETK